MAGDKFNIRANSWYRKNGVTPGTPVNPLADLVAALAGSVGSISSVHGGATTTELASSGVFTPGVTSFLNGQTVGTGKPKAYVNWVLFDEQVKLVSNSSGFDVAGNDQEFKTHLLENKLVDKNGYLYIYVSNETPNIDVFFDNLQVTHIRGPILEETHYYPFGLVMQGISSKALAFGGSLNRKKFNGVELSNNEFSDGSGLEWYDTDFRRYDQQIGRFTGIDALSELNFNWSPYAFAQNNPILFSDPYGLDTVKGQLPNDYNPQPGDVWINDGKTTIYDQERGWAQQQELGEVVVGNNPANTEAYNAAQSALTAAGCYVIGWDYYYNMRYKGDWMYRNSKGKITSIFDTKWGSNKTPDNLGNIKNYSQNAQKGIRATRVVKIIKTASGTIVVLSTLAEWGQAFYAYSTNDSNADALLAKAGVSTGVTLLSATLPGVGWTIGGIYFLIDATIGWENAIPSYIEVEKNKADMRTLKITNFSDFKF